MKTANGKIKELRVYSIGMRGWTKIVAKNKDEAIEKLVDTTDKLLVPEQNSDVNFLSFAIEGITEEVFELDGENFTFKSENHICPCCGEESEE
jgi:hypothetical protein